MTTIYMQPPRGGCENCGAPVRTRKSYGWVCWRCERELAGRKRPPERPVAPQESA